jgi:hypothetical protein
MASPAGGIIMARPRRPKRLLGASIPIASLLLVAAPTHVPAVDATAKAEPPPSIEDSVLEDSWLTLSDGSFVAVVGGSARQHFDFYGYPTGNALGSILGFRPSGADADAGVTIGSPVLEIDGRRLYVVYASVESADDGSAIHSAMAGEVGDTRHEVRIDTTYSLRPGSGVLDIRSKLVNTGSESLEDVLYWLHFGVEQFYVFSPYDAMRHRRLQFEIIPRPDHSLGWVDLNTRDDDGQQIAVDLAPGEVHEVRYALVVDRDGGSLLQKVYRLLGVDATPVTIRVEDFEGGPFEIVVRDDASGAVFFRTFQRHPSPLRAVLPPGIYTVTGNLFPAVVETVLSVGSDEAGCTLVNPPRGRVAVAVRDRDGAPVPGKVTFLGLHPTTSPYFPPHDPIRSGRAWEEVKNSVFPGLSAVEVELPVGTYLASASRGPEYSLAQMVVEVLADRIATLSFVVDRVVDTTGLVAVDPHSHTLRSDGAVTAEERVKSLVAEGVEVAVATDHFYRHDLAPAAKSAGLGGFLTVIAGTEVSIRNPRDYEYTLDFNLYPLGPGDSGWSAPETLADEVAPIFEETRRRYPGALIQVNHPRYSSWDYLNSYRLDPESAATAREGFWTGFDLLEVLNGPSTRTSSNAATIRDWLNLLARGFYYPAVGSSDAHQVDTEEAGYSRTYVYAPDQDAGAVDIGAVVDALRRGRSFVTNGPIVEVATSRGALPGDVVGAAGGVVELLIDVRAAPWIRVDEARVIVNREVDRVLPVEAPTGTVHRLRQEIRLELTRDAFVVVEVTGGASLFPVVQSISKTGRSEDAVTPYALTNPIFIDVDGNGRFDPPLPGIIRPAAADAD